MTICVILIRWGLSSFKKKVVNINSPTVTIKKHKKLSVIANVHILNKKLLI